jgi:hypothetical protein
MKPTMLHEIVVRTVEGRKLFRPIRELTQAILNVIGRALARFPLPIHGFNYLSNHKHLLLGQADGDQIRGFMCHLNANTARVVKRITGWTGSVWARYRAIPVLDDLASIRRLRYLLANGVKEGLVEHPLEWPGASCAASLATNQPIPTEWVEHPRDPGNREPTRHRSLIELAPLPVWSHLSSEERASRIRELMDDIAEEARRERRGRPVLGVAALQAQDPFEPTQLDETPPLLAHVTDADVLAAHLGERRGFINAHRSSTHTQRRMRRPAAYPPFGFPAALPFQSPDDDDDDE